MSFKPICLSEHIPKLNDANHVYVAFSGGLDSHVLLHAIVSLIDSKFITAVHVNHQLSPNADSWQQHCKNVCFKLGIHIITEVVKVKKKGEGLEQAARDVRYKIFTKLLSKNDLLIMAHHADDQAETVLYRLLRGAGTKGLSGMPACRPLGLGELFRPFLSFSRDELEEYASSHNIKWIEDESNINTNYDRNFLRHKVLPVIAQRWPDCAYKLNHAAKLCAESDYLVDALSMQDLGCLSEKSERIGWSISIDALFGLDQSRQANVIRCWIAKNQLPPPRYSVLKVILNQMLFARPDSQSLVSWGGVQLRIFKRKMYLLPAGFDTSSQAIEDTGELAPTSKTSIKWDGVSTVNLFNGSRLSAKLSSTGGLKVSKKNYIEIRFRSGGERCKPLGRSGSNTLKKLFQEYTLEPWLRNKVPLIYVDGKLAAVGDLWVCTEFFTSTEKTGIQLQWSFF